MGDLDGALRGWQAGLQDAGFPADGLLAPGLPLGQVAGSLAGAGLAPAADALAWFAWHDGLRPGVPPAALAPTRFAPLGLAEALALRDERLAAAPGAAQAAGRGRPAGFYWQPGWLPLARDGRRVLVVELGRDVTPAGPLRRIDWQASVLRLPVALHLREAVHVLTRTLATSAWHWDDDADAWAFDPARLPARLRHPLLE